MKDTKKKTGKLVTLDDSEIPAPPPSPGLGMIINDRLARLFYELEADAYNADYHNYYYKEANQIIRKHFERLPDLISAVVEERIKERMPSGDRVIEFVGCTVKNKLSERENILIRTSRAWIFNQMIDKKHYPKNDNVDLLPCGEVGCQNIHEKIYRGCGQCEFKLEGKQ